MDSIKIVDSIVAGDKETFMQAFQSAISSKVSDALEIKKVELASTLVTPETETISTEVADETNGITAEVDGADSIAEPVES
jgi:hypothetical protein